MPTWNSDQYLRFATERTQPAIDLAARIAIEAPARVIDLGCGPGNSTAILAQRWPAANITGLDSSKDMLTQAQQNFPDRKWINGDIASWQADAAANVGFDVVFSNA